MMNVSKTDIHPRVQSKIKTIKFLRKKKKIKRNVKNIKYKEKMLFMNFKDG